MTHPKHHLDDATLLSYSSGALRMPLSVVVAAHIGMCPTCRARLDQADELGGTLMQQQDPAALSARVREAVLARLDDEPATMAEDDSSPLHRRRPRRDACRRNCTTTSAPRSATSNGSAWFRACIAFLPMLPVAAA